MRNKECPQYSLCLEEAARIRFNFDCGRCFKEGGKSSKPDKTKMNLAVEEERMEPEKKDLKECTRCKKEYPCTPDYFSKNAATKDGFEYWCRTCKVNTQRARREVKKEVKSKKTEEHNPLIVASPEEIIKALRRGVVDEIISLIQKAFK